MLSRILIGGLCVCGLVAVFLFQRIDVAGFLGSEAFIHKFLINRTFRFLLNDAFAIGLIYALFQERKYVVFSLYVQVVGMVLIFIPIFCAEDLLASLQRSPYFFFASAYS